jgi:hypothetical protein
MLKSVQVEVLTAEVRVLMVGSRQVTLSVFRQLDLIPPEALEPFGRVNDKSSGTWLAVGRTAGGVLARASYSFARDLTPLEGYELVRIKNAAGAGYRYPRDRDRIGFVYSESSQATAVAVEAENQRWAIARGPYDSLPLIVLAGLR